METFENKIKKIRTTIDDIRLDIESMKTKNEKTLSNMMNSIANLSNSNINDKSLDRSERRQSKEDNMRYKEREKDPRERERDTYLHSNTLSHNPNQNLITNASVLSDISSMGKNKLPPTHKTSNSYNIGKTSATERPIGNHAYTPECHSYSNYSGYTSSNTKKKNQNLNNFPSRDKESSFEQVEDNIVKRYERIKNRPPLNSKHNSLTNNSGGSFTNYNFTYDKDVDRSDYIHNNYNEVSKNENKFNSYVNSVPFKDSNSIQPVKSFTPEVSYGHSRNKSNYEPSYKVTNSETLEKQIAELHLVVNDLQKQNTLLQMEVTKSQSNPLPLNAYPTDKSDKNYSSSDNLTHNTQTYTQNSIPEKNHSRNFNPSVPYSQSYAPGKNNQFNHNSTQNYNFSYNSNSDLAGHSNFLTFEKEKELKRGNTTTNYNYEDIVHEMISLMGNSIEPSELPNKFREYLLTFKSNKIRDEFIDKLSNIYSSLSGEENVYVDIKVLWRWVKSLIQTKRNNSMSKYTLTSTNDDGYKDFCENIIKEYYLRDVNELKNFINDLLSKNSKNNQRVGKIKKMLLRDPQSASRDNTNDSRSNYSIY